MKEDFLQYLWKHKIVPQVSTLASGQNLVIHSFGTPNRLSGADFFNAQLQIDEQLWAGNVELHVKSSYWYAHRHEQDPAYQNVILHVVWEHDVEVFDCNQRPIPTLELRHVIDQNIVKRYEILFSKSHTFINCDKNYKKVQEYISFSWNERLFVERLEQKSFLIDKLLTESHSDWEKVLFLMLLKSFGGTVNGENFLNIGKTIDFSIIRKEKNNPLYVEALLFGQGQLLSKPTEGTYFQTLLANYDYLKRKYNLKNNNLHLEFSKLRPQGFPTIRLSQLGQVYEKNEGLFSKIIETKDIQQLKTVLTVETSPFWETHYTFGKTSKKVKKKISNSLIELIWINVILPVKYIYFKYLGKDISEELMESLRQMKPEKNTIIDHFENIGAYPTSAFDTQILLQQYNQYCKEKKCLNCAVGISLLKEEK
ncbi:DUF2851 family protein [Capnocytophaga canis]|uniref:DUF2851 family protein n=1 Tax=Capnocytophaga canis TaxID=1848903 RepID=UPI0037D30ECD